MKNYLLLLSLLFATPVFAAGGTIGNFTVTDGGIGIGAASSAYVTTPQTTSFIVAGNVGVGTFIPQSKLQVRITTNENFIVQGHQSVSTGIAIASINDSNGVNLPLELRGSRIVLTQGNVGVGSAAPGQALDVQGNVRVFTGFIQGTNVGISTTGATCACTTFRGGICTAGTCS